MSLIDAIEQLKELAPKASGHLIQHKDWNTLIRVLGEYGISLSKHDQDLNALHGEVRSLDKQLARVATQLQDLDNYVDKLDQQIKPLLDNYRVTMSCNKLAYAVAEQCEITATVTDLTGHPLPAPYPWVDFITTWGRLSAHGAYNTRSRAGDHSLSVQVNAEGIATVVLRAENSEGFTQPEEEQVSAVINRQMPEIEMTVAQAIMAAATPTDNWAMQAYSVVAAEYERKDSMAMRTYADTYHARNPEWQLAPTGPSYWGTWRDYPATIIAMAKPATDRRTPDGVRGNASLQVTFRDWLWSWSHHYVEDTEEIEVVVVEELVPIFDRESPFEAFEDLFQEHYKEGGIIGRKKYMSAVKKAVGRINPGADPYKQAAKEQIRLAISAQESAEIHGSAQSGSNAMVMEAHIGHGKQSEAVQHSVHMVSQEIVESRNVQDAVNVLEGRMQAAESVGRTINANLTQINDNVRAINPLDENSLRANVQKISADIASLKANIGQ